MSVINEDDKVLLKKDSCYKIVIVKQEKLVELDKLTFSIHNLIGSTYGSSFTVDKEDLVKIVDNSQFNARVDALVADDVNTNKDNRNINRNGRNQLMTATDITEMKNKGESGDVILSKLIENSVSFSKKTTYSQEKYLRKKKKQYLPVISVHKITTRLLCDLYSVRNKLKIMNLRIDSVAQILSLSNAQFGSRILLTETCAGLILGALLERGAKVVNFFHGSAPVLPENYTEWRELDDIVYNIPLSQVVPLQIGQRYVRHFVSSDNNANSKQETELPVTEMVVDGSESTAGCKRELLEVPYGRVVKRQRISPEDLAARREERDRRREEARNFLYNGPIDAVVIVTRFHLADLSCRLLSFLGSGKPFVVYSQFMQPLIDVYDALRKAGGCCSLRITEGWLRNYQVLAERTHPEMMMSGTGGYILSGIKLSAVSD